MGDLSLFFCPRNGSRRLESNHFKCKTMPARMRARKSARWAHKWPPAVPNSRIQAPLHMRQSSAISRAPGGSFASLMLHRWFCSFNFRFRKWLKSAQGRGMAWLDSSIAGYQDSSGRGGASASVSQPGNLRNFCLPRTIFHFQLFQGVATHSGWAQLYAWLMLR